MVFLPGIGDVLEDFELNRFVETVRTSARPADIVAADLHAGYYFRSSVLERLHEDVFEPAKACGYERIWLVGISLGGFGALLYAMNRTSDVQGLVLLAPYVGEDAVVREIASAGGLRRWDPGNAETDDHARRMWGWVKQHTSGDRSSALEIYLAFGDRDCFAPGNALLADVLPNDRVFTLRGRHDWHTWRRLWQAFLAQRDSRYANADPPSLTSIHGGRGRLE